MGMLPITTGTSDELFSRINIDDFEKPWNSKIRGFIDFCDVRLQRTLEEWTATKWLEVNWQFANRNCYIGFRASRKNKLKFFVLFCVSLLYMVVLGATPCSFTNKFDPKSLVLLEYGL